MFDQHKRFQAVAAAADAWRDPEYEGRARAVEETLRAPNAFTEEAVAFAANQQMALLTEEALAAWIRDRRASAHAAVGVLNAGNVPLAGLQDFLATVLAGHRYIGAVSSKSPALLPAFVRDVRRFDPEIEARFASLADLLRAANALVATGSDETIASLRARLDETARLDKTVRLDETARLDKTARLDEMVLAPDRCLFRGHSFAAGVLDGEEREDTYERLAEDILLHEGFGCRNVAVLWAPRGLSPDGLLEAMARFRGVFPAHEGTAGRLAMQRALLEAVGASHAWGEGLEFLVSRGEPEAQAPGHLRWVEYDDLAEAAAWLAEQPVQLAVAEERVQKRLAFKGLCLVPGEAQRPALAWRPDGVDTVEFLASL